MLTAVTQEHRKVVASIEVRRAAVLCPACGGDLIVRLPVARIPHFAHHPHAGCTGLRVAGRRRAHPVHDDLVDGQQTLFDL